MRHRLVLLLFGGMMTFVAAKAWPEVARYLKLRAM